MAPAVQKGVTILSNTLARNSESGLVSRTESAAPWTAFRNLFGFDPFQEYRSNWAFDYNVTRTEHGYEVEVPVPGYNPDEIDITFKDGILSVAGRSERRTFSRSFTVPEDVNTDAISASVQNGMLLLKLERRPEAQPKKIQINAS